MTSVWSMYWRGPEVGPLVPYRLRIGHGIGGLACDTACGWGLVQLQISLRRTHVRTLQHSPRQTPRRGTLTWSARCTRPRVQDSLAAMWHSCPTCTRCTLQTAPAESSAVHVPTVHSMLIWGVHIHIWGALGARVPPRSAWDAGEAPWWALAWTLLHGMRCGDSKRRPRWARRSARR